MAWTDTRAALVELLEDIDGIDAVLVAPAVSEAALGTDRTVVVLTPPGHTTTAGGDPSRVWSQRMTVLRHIAGTSQAAVTDAIDTVTDATVAVSDAMGSSITLGGAVGLVGPVKWSEGAAHDVGALVYAGQAGTSEITEFGIGQRPA